MHRFRMIVIMSLASLHFSGCMHVLSPQARDTVDQGVTFAQVKADPDRFRGKTLLLGGLIVDIQVGKDGTTLEVFRWELDRWGEPIAVDETGARFLVITDRLLDPVLYDPGRLITMTATVSGIDTRPLGQIKYTYPVFDLKESYLWEKPIRLGIHRHPNIYVPYYVGPEKPGRTSPYDPGYYAYPYTPYWLRSLAR